LETDQGIGGRSCCLDELIKAKTGWSFMPWTSGFVVFVQFSGVKRPHFSHILAQKWQIIYFGWWQRLSGRSRLSMPPMFVGF
jgi:hypothetical protein